MSAYAEAVKVWVARKASSSKNHMVWAEDITEVKFGEGDWGACPTCSDPFVAIIYTIKRNGKSTTHYMDIEEMSLADIVQECMDIYKTLIIAGKDFIPEPRKKGRQLGEKPPRILR